MKLNISQNKKKERQYVYSLYVKKQKWQYTV